MRNKKIQMNLFIFAIVLLGLIPGVFAAASFQVTLLTCTEVAIGGTFSCTVNIRNSGDAAGTVGTVILFPDANDWLQESNYPKTVGSSVNPGESIEVTFMGLRAVKQGNYGFSEVRIDNAADTSSIVTGAKVNTVNVVVTVSNSASSGIMGSNFTVIAEVTAGGNIDVVLSFGVDSGGCGIGNQDAQKTIKLRDGNKQSRIWTVTQGTSGDCKFAVTAAASGSGVKVDSTSSTVSCTNCPTDSGGTTSGGGGGGGAGSAAKVALGELTGAVTYDLAKGEKISFKLGGESHSVTVLSFTETTAELSVQSSPQKVKLIVGEEKEVDVTGDGKNDLAIKLNSVNVFLKKVSLSITPLGVAGAPSAPTQPSAPSGGGESGAPSGVPSSGGIDTGPVSGGESGLWVWLFFAVILAVIIAFVVVLIVRKRR